MIRRIRADEPEHQLSLARSQNCTMSPIFACMTETDGIVGDMFNFVQYIRAKIVDSLGMYDKNSDWHSPYIVDKQKPRSNPRTRTVRQSPP